MDFLGGTHQLIVAIGALIVGTTGLLAALLNIFRFFGDLPETRRYPVVGVTAHSSYRPGKGIKYITTASYRRAIKLCRKKPVLLINCPIKLASKIDFLVGDVRQFLPNYVYEKDKDRLEQIWSSQIESQ